MTAHHDTDDRYRRARRRFVWSWMALLLLLAATASIARLHLGVGNLVASLGIAAIKAAIVAWVFMALREGSSLQRLAGAAGVAALAVLALLSLVDFMPRRDEPSRWQTPEQVVPMLTQDHSRSLPSPTADGERPTLKPTP